MKISGEQMALELAPYAVDKREWLQTYSALSFSAVR